MALHVLSFLLPLVTVCATVPLFALLARRVGLVDRPDARRKLHAKVVPLVGGVAVAVAVGVVVVVLTAFDLPTAWLSSLPLLGAVGLVFAVGVLDDRLRLAGKWKLLGQLVAAGGLVWGGVQIQAIDLFGYEVSPGYLAVPLTLLWLVGASNSVNLLDGMDGMVGTVGLTMVLGMALVFAMRGHEVGTVVTLAGAGALLGFLAYNLPPARVFMGDSGSVTLGLVLGILALKLEGGDGRFALGPACVALFFLPIADSCAAFTRRLLTGRSIFATDRGHLHHRLAQAGYEPREVLRLVLALNLILVAGVVARESTGSAAPVAIALGIVATFLVARRLFGHTELVLLARRGADRVPIGPALRRRLGRAVRVHIQGSCQVWDEAWAVMRGRAGGLGASSVSLNISAPALHEIYLAHWDCPCGDPDAAAWRGVWPVRYGGQVIGWLTVSAEPDPVDALGGVAAVTNFAFEVERQIAAALDEWSFARLTGPDSGAAAWVEKPRAGSHPELVGIGAD